MRSVTVAFTVIGTYAAVASFVFAATVAETILLYPNIFHDIPASLELAERFMSEIAVGDLMRPLGGALVICALIACAAGVLFRIARGWLTASLVSLVGGQGLLSVLYLWPRASVLFDDRHRHTLDEIQRAATEFQIGQGVRILACALTASFAVAAALACHRARVLASVR